MSEKIESAGDIESDLLWAHNIGVTGKVVITLDLGTEIQEVPNGKNRD